LRRQAPSNTCTISTGIVTLGAQVLVPNDEVDLDRAGAAPWLPQMPGKAGPAGDGALKDVL